MTHATPRPWKVEVLNNGGSGEVIAVVTDRQNNPIHLATVNDRYTAALIVHAVNTLDEAKAALDAAVFALQQGPVYAQCKAVLAKLEGKG